jgi:serralysin
MYAENGTGPVATYTASGPYAASAVWSVSGADAGGFSISTAGVLTFNSPPDYEAPADADTNNIYMVTVNAYDGTTMAEHSVIVTVTDVDDGLTISGPSSTDYVENGTGPVATYTASGPYAASAVWSVSGADAGGFSISTAGVLTFNSPPDYEAPDAASATWSLSGDDARDFSISSDGVLTFMNSPDYEAPADADTNNVYMVTVNADDGTNMAEHSVIVTVTDVDDGLTISGPSSTDYVENGTGPVAMYTASGPDAASATWSLSGDDARDFSISSDGVLTFMNSPDYEAPADADTNNIYMVTVNAYDGTTMAEHSVIVTVTDVDDGLTISGPSSTDYVENGTGPVAMYTASGPDAASATWSLSGDDARDFSISSDGVLTFMNSPDYEAPADADTNNIYMVTVNAYDGTTCTW